MHSILLALAATGMASLANAFTKPGQNTWGPLLTPDLTNSVTQGKTFDITWDPEDHPTDGVTVSIVLCHGPSTNCVTADTAIAEGIPASQKSFEWSVPSDLAPGKQNTDTGYGLLIIVDGTGEFQYSTQFSVLEGKGGSSNPSSTTAKPTIVTSTDAAGSIILGPPASYQTDSILLTISSVNGTVVTGTIPWGPSTATATGTGGFASTLGGTTIPLAGSTLSSIVSAPATTVPAAGGSATTTTGAAGPSASTFDGAADHMTFNLGGLAAVGVIAMFAL